MHQHFQTKKFADIIIPRGAENFGIIFHYLLNHNELNILRIGNTSAIV